MLPVSCIVQQGSYPHHVPLLGRNPLLQGSGTPTCDGMVNKQVLWNCIIWQLIPCPLTHQFSLIGILTSNTPSLIGTLSSYTPFLPDWYIVLKHPFPSWLVPCPQTPLSSQIGTLSSNTPFLPDWYPVLKHPFPSWLVPCPQTPISSLIGTLSSNTPFLPDWYPVR